MSLISPFELLDLEAQQLQQLTLADIKRSKRRLLLEFDLSETSTIFVNGKELSKNDIITVLDDLHEQFQNPEFFKTLKESPLWAFCLNCELSDFKQLSPNQSADTALFELLKPFYIKSFNSLIFNLYKNKEYEALQLIISENCLRGEADELLCFETIQNELLNILRSIFPLNAIVLQDSQPIDYEKIEAFYVTIVQQIDVYALNLLPKYLRVPSLIAVLLARLSLIVYKKLQKEELATVYLRLASSINTQSKVQPLFDYYHSQFKIQIKGTTYRKFIENNTLLLQFLENGDTGFFLHYTHKPEFAEEDFRNYIKADYIAHFQTALANAYYKNRADVAKKMTEHNLFKQKPEIVVCNKTLFFSIRDIISHLNTLTHKIRTSANKDGLLTEVEDFLDRYIHIEALNALPYFFQKQRDSIAKSLSKLALTIFEHYRNSQLQRKIVCDFVRHIKSELPLVKGAKRFCSNDVFSDVNSLDINTLKKKFLEVWDFIQKFRLLLLFLFSVAVVIAVFSQYFTGF